MLSHFKVPISDVYMGCVIMFGRLILQNSKSILLVFDCWLASLDSRWRRTRSLVGLCLNLLLSLSLDGLLLTVGCCR